MTLLTLGPGIVWAEGNVVSIMYRYLTDDASH